jgi:ankyrin repeat protein
LLIAKGAEVDAKGGWPGGTALDYAAEHGHKEVAELLITKGADIHAQRGYPASDTPLHSAARNGHKSLIDLLINKGADVNAENDKGETPIEVIGSRNRQDIIDLLKKHGAKEKPPQSFRQKWESMSAEEKKELMEQMRKRLEANKKQETKE